MIVIGFSRSNDFKGRLIRSITGGYYNHTWIGHTVPIWGGQWVTHAHASTGQVIFQRAELLREQYDESVCFEVRYIDIEKGMKRTRGYINKKYDFPSVIWNGILMVLYRSTGIEFFNPIIDHNKMSCSEFVALILQRSGYSGVQEKDAELYPPDGPHGLYPICKKSGVFRKVDFDLWVDRIENV